MRERFGSRRIDASAPQSEKDNTPSGRKKRFMDLGATEQEAIQQDKMAWRNLFTPSTQAISRATMAAPKVMDRFQPRGLPTVQQPEMLASAPVSGSPLNTPFQNDMESVFGEQPFFRKRRPYLGTALADAEKWLT